MHKTQRGFTLIELLVVIAIIGILSSVVLASLNSARKKGRDARRVADVKQIQLALELYYDANQSYPAGTALTGLTTGQYISVVPADPTDSGSYVYSFQATDGASTPAACGTAPCAGYVIKAVIEGGAASVPAGDLDGTIAGLTCDDPSYCVKP